MQKKILLTAFEGVSPKFASSFGLKRFIKKLMTALLVDCPADDTHWSSFFFLYALIDLPLAPVYALGGLHAVRLNGILIVPHH